MSSAFISAASADTLTVNAPALGATNESLLDFARRRYADDDSDYVSGAVEMWDGVPVWTCYNPYRDKYMAWVCEETWTADDALRYVVEHHNEFRDDRHIEVRALVRGDSGAVGLIEVLDDESF